MKIKREDVLKHKAPAVKPSPGNSERYNTINENGFQQTKEEAFSTISTDVDRAAYANVRRFLNQGQLPPADAVRTKEMMNYFNYDDPDPKTKEEIALRTEFMTCPWNPQNQFLRLRYKPNTGGRSRKVSVPIAARHLEEDMTSN